MLWNSLSNTCSPSRFAEFCSQFWINAPSETVRCSDTSLPTQKEEQREAGERTCRRRHLPLSARPLRSPCRSFCGRRPDKSILVSKYYCFHEVVVLKQLSSWLDTGNVLKMPLKGQMVSTLFTICGVGSPSLQSFLWKYLLVESFNCSK